MSAFMTEYQWLQHWLEKHYTVVGLPRIRIIIIHLKKLEWHKAICEEVLVSIEVIIMSCRSHGYPWPSIVTSPSHSSPLVGLQGHISYPHIAAECMFELVVLLLPGHMWGSIGVHHLWARLCFSSSDLHVWFVKLG